MLFNIGIYSVSYQDQIPHLFVERTLDNKYKIPDTVSDNLGDPVTHIYNATKYHLDEISVKNIRSIGNHIGYIVTSKRISCNDQFTTIPLASADTLCDLTDEQIFVLNFEYKVEYKKRKAEPKVIYTPRPAALSVNYYPVPKMAEYTLSLEIVDGYTAKKHNLELMTIKNITDQHYSILMDKINKIWAEYFAGTTYTIIPVKFSFVDGIPCTYVDIFKDNVDLILFQDIIKKFLMETLPDVTIVNLPYKLTAKNVYYNVERPFTSPIRLIITKCVSQ